MTALTYLTADLGNSALKLLAWEHSSRGLAQAAECLRVPAERGFSELLSRWLADRRPSMGIAVSSVAKPELEEELFGVIRDALGDGMALLPRAGLRVECRTPHTVGSDRLFAARGAWERLRVPALVVDAGTALTVDALASDASSGEPVFLGGAIAPGPSLLAKSLACGGARLCAVEPDPHATALGRDTREALLAGIGIGFVGAARYLVERVANAADLRLAPVVLTGGARAFLEAPETFVGRDVSVFPVLVHEGLLAAATEQVLGERWHPSV